MPTFVWLPLCSTLCQHNLPRPTLLSICTNLLRPLPQHHLSFSFLTLQALKQHGSRMWTGVRVTAGRSQPLHSCIPTATLYTLSIASQLFICVGWSDLYTYCQLHNAMLAPCVTYLCTSHRETSLWCWIEFIRLNTYHQVNSVISITRSALS